MKWFRHPQHGYMLRIPDSPGYETVITALVCNALDYQRDEARWEAHKLRLHVNGGCGAVYAEQTRAGDHNPEFRRVRASSVPKWIVRDFTGPTETAEE